MKSDQVHHDLSSRLQDDIENLKASTLKLNEVSQEYRSTLSLIDEKIIYLAAGTISLFLTFLGILFNSPKDTSTLPYEAMFLSIFCFMATIVSLLAARWLWSLYVFSASHRHYLENLQTRHETELQILTSKASIHDQSTYAQMSQEDLKSLTSKIEEAIQKTEQQIKIDHAKEQKRSTWAKYLALLAYTWMILGYVLAIVFFMSLVSIMKDTISRF